MFIKVSSSFVDQSFAGVDQGSLVGVCMEEYKSLCAAVTISAALFNMHIHTD